MTGFPDIIWLSETQSTNAEARKRIGGLDNLSVVGADVQTEGRGQGSHIWHSEPHQNLTASIVLKGTGLAARDGHLISKAAACSVCTYLQSLGIKSRIKLPNDIWVEDKKICGLLIEHSVMEGRLEWSIVGIGLNLNETEFPANLPNPVSVKRLTGLDTEPRAAARSIAVLLGEHLSMDVSGLETLFAELAGI